MKKIFILLILLLILTGCVKYDNASFCNKLNEYFSSLKDRSLYQNNYSSFYNYFLPSDMFEIESDDKYVVLGYLNSKIIVNINIPSIVEEKVFLDGSLYDDGFFDEKKLVYEKNGTISNLLNENINFIFKAYLVGDYYYLHFINSDVNIYAISSNEEAYMTFMHLITVARGFTVNKELILSEYSFNNILTFNEKTIDLYETYLPVDGKLDDLIN